MGAFLQFAPSEGAPLQTLSFDVVLTETPNFPTEITEHVVEKGANITDNVRVGLKQVALEVFVSNAPITTDAEFGTGALQTTGPVNLPDTPQAPKIPGQPIIQVPQVITFPLISVPLVGALGANVADIPMFPNVGLPPTKGGSIGPNTIIFDTEFDAVSSTHDLLDALRTGAILITIWGSKAVYENMVIERFSMKRDADDGTGATFTIEFKEIRFVTSKTVAAPVPAVARGNTPVHKGSQETTEIPKGEKFKSAAKVLQGWFGGLLNVPSVPTIP